MPSRFAKGRDGGSGESIRASGWEQQSVAAVAVDMAAVECRNGMLG